MPTLTDGKFRFHLAKVALVAGYDSLSQRQAIKLATNHLSVSINHIAATLRYGSLYIAPDLRATLVHTLATLKGVNMAILKGRPAKTSDEYVTIIETHTAEIINVIKLCAANGVLVTFGRTKSGNALLVSLYDGEDNEKIYITNEQEFAEFYDALLDTFETSRAKTSKPVRAKDKSGNND